MTGFSLSLTHDRSAARWASVGMLGALIAASQIAVPIPGTPVPLTLTPLLVVLSGMMLGPTVGAATMVAYLALGAIGVPVFAPMGAPGVMRLVGPTGGYLLAYPAAAYVAGVLTQRLPTLSGRWIAACAGVAVLFAGGLAQLTILTGSVTRAVALGITPFALLDVVKAFVAALLTKPQTPTSLD